MLIGEVSERSGVSARMLRHYDSIGLVSPTARTAGGYRRYTEDDIRRLFHVEGLRSLGLGLQEIADALGDRAFSPGAMVEDLIVRARERLAREEELLRKLNQVQASEPGDWSDVLHTIGLMRGLAAEAPSKRQRFALSLHAEEDRSVGLLTEAALDETDLNVAGALDWVLSLSGDRAVPTLTRALESPSAGRRRRAVEALEKIGSPRALETLAGAFRSPDPVVAGRAILALGRGGGADAIPGLVSLVVIGRDDVEASDVLAGLAERHGRAEEIVDAIAGELDRVDDAARLRLTTALAEIPGSSARATLTRLAGDDDRGVALTATFLLRSRQPEG